MVFPTQLTDYLQPSVDKFTFSIGEALDDSEVEITVNGGTAAFVIPCVINIEDELILVESKTSTELETCTRGYGGTSAEVHPDSAIGYLPFTAEHYLELVESKDAVIKYLCRTEATLPGSGVEYEMVEYADEIYIYNGAGWDKIGLTFSHDDWKELDLGDPHPVYYTLTELISAHDSITGGHVVGGDEHDHLGGQGFGCIDTTIARISSAPTYDGEVVLNTTTGVLYISYIVDTPDVTDWILVTGAPEGLIMAFDPANLSGSCPAGWSRYTTLDDRYIKGTSTSSQTTGGSATHEHTFDATDVITHQHSINAQIVGGTGIEYHIHYCNQGTTGGGAGVGSTGAGGNWVSQHSSSNGGHSHTGTMANDSESTGEASPSTDSANGEPPYQKVIWCQKD